jgi:hypothetical protein
MSAGQLDSLSLNANKIQRQTETVTILVKGSRSARMERVVEALQGFDFSNSVDELSTHKKEPL